MSTKQTQKRRSAHCNDQTVPPLVLRPGRKEDAERCGTICYEAFRGVAERHNFPPDFPSAAVAQDLMSYMFSKPTVHSVIAELNQRVVGSNFLWTNASVAGIGPITIDPAAQNSAIGRRLMEWALDKAGEIGMVSVRLVQAAYHNRSLSLYSKLGFVVREPLSTVQGPAINLRVPGHAVRSASAADVGACNSLHVQLHGFAREQDLRDAIGQETAMVVERAGRITGYTTRIGFFGHAIGESNDDLKALIGSAPSFAGPGFLLPTRNAPLLRWCLDHGLQIVQPMSLMSCGFYNKPAGAFLPSILF